MFLRCITFRISIYLEQNVFRKVPYDFVLFISSLELQFHFKYIILNIVLMKCFKITDWIFGVHLLNLIYTKPEGKLFLGKIRARVSIRIF